MIWYGYSRSLFTHDFVEELLERAGFTEVDHCRVQADGEPVPGDRRARQPRAREPLRGGGQIATGSCSTGTSSGSPAATSRSGTTSTTCAPRRATRRWCASARTRCGTRPIRGTPRASTSLGADEDVDFDVLFLSGHRLARHDPERASAPSTAEPIINLIQHVRHACQNDPLGRHRFLPHKAIRICVSPEIDAAILAHRPRARARCSRSPTRSTSTAVAAPGRAPAARHRRAGRGQQAARAGARRRRAAARGRAASWSSSTPRIPRGELLGLMGRARVTRARARTRRRASTCPRSRRWRSARVVVCPDCVGNRSFCLPGENCFRPALRRGRDRGGGRDGAAARSPAWTSCAGGRSRRRRLTTSPASGARSSRSSTRVDELWAAASRTHGHARSQRRDRQQAPERRRGVGPAELDPGAAAPRLRRVVRRADRRGHVRRRRRARRRPSHESENRRYFEQVVERFGLERARLAALRRRARGERACRWQELLAGRAARRDLLVNISGHLDLEPLMSRLRRKAYVDLDPGFTQFWHADGTGGARLEGHDVYFTVGENIGRPGCPIPTVRPRLAAGARRPWCSRTGRSPTPATPDRFTTVGAWRGAFGPVEHDGRTYGAEGARVPQGDRAPAPCRRSGSRSRSTSIPATSATARRSRRNGWTLVDPRATVPGPLEFRDYVQGSGAEFSVAQGIYVETNSGWFSDRTVRYLASGRPALVQDTGFSANLPGRRGAAGLHRPRRGRRRARERIAADYEHHRARRARARRGALRLGHRAGPLPRGSGDRALTGSAGGRLRGRRAPTRHGARADSRLPARPDGWVRGDRGPVVPMAPRRRDRAQPSNLPPLASGGRAGDRVRLHGGRVLADRHPGRSRARVPRRRRAGPPDRLPLRHARDGRARAWTRCATTAGA